MKENVKSRWKRAEGKSGLRKMRGRAVLDWAGWAGLG